MRSPTGPVSALLAMYGGARKSGLLNAPWFQRIFLGSYFVYKRHFEDSFHALVKAYPALISGGHVLDVGANIGYTATVFAHAVTPPFKVIAFEPEPENVKNLDRVLAARGLTGLVERVHAAVGASDGTVRLWQNDKSLADHRVLTDEFRREVPENSPVVSVPMVSIDSYLSTHHHDDPISFIKIDVQGYELRSSKAWSRRCPGGPESLLPSSSRRAP